MIDVRIGYPFWLRPFVAGGVAGITFGSRVYLHPCVEGLPADRVVAILRHEVVHVNQYRRHGFVVFLAKYVVEYLGNRLRGMSASDAYRHISFEREAFAEEEMMERGEGDA